MNLVPYTGQLLEPGLGPADAPCVRLEGEEDHSTPTLFQVVVETFRAGAVATTLAGALMPLLPPDWLPGSEPPVLYQDASSPDLAREAFERDYPSDPEGAVSRLLEQLTPWEGATAFGVSPVQVAAALLSHLPGAAYGRQNLLVGALKRSASPQQIVQAALSESHSPFGPEVLQATAGLLEHYGRDAWRALKWLSDSGRPECRYFVWQTASCEGVDEATRAGALVRLALGADPDTRREVTEVLESGLLTEPSSVWQALAAAPEEDVRSLAADRLGGLSA